MNKDINKILEVVFKNCLSSSPNSFSISLEEGRKLSSLELQRLQKSSLKVVMEDLRFYHVLSHCNVKGTLKCSSTFKSQIR